MMVNTAVDIYKRIDETDWKDFGAAVATVADVADKAGAIAETGIKNFGGPEARKTLGKVQNFIRDKKRDVEQLKGDAELLWEGLKRIKDGKTADAVAAIANGFPVTVNDGGKLQIDFGKKSIRFEDPALQEALQGLLRSGRYILNDAEARGKDGLAKLAGLPPAELKKKLNEVLDEVVKELPPDIAAGITDLPKDAKAEGENALRRLKDRIEGLKDDDPSLRLLSQTLAGGMLFLRQGKVVVAVERPFAEEARKLQDRLRRHAREVAEGELGKLAKKIDGIRDELDRYGQELIKASKKDELRKLADTAIEPAIKRVKEAVGELQAEIKKAEDQLSDSKEQEMIATYEAEAARLVLERTVPLKKQADLRVERARKVIQQAKLAADIEVLRGEQSLALLRAAEIKVARLEDLVRHCFTRCLANGVNPLSDRKAAERLPLPVVSLRGVLYGHGTPEDRYNRPLIDAAAAECLGMIRWCQLLGFTDGEETPVGLYAELATAVASSDPLWTGEVGPSEAVGGRIKGIGKRLDALYRKRAGAMIVDLETREVGPSNIVWRHGDQGDLVEAIVADRWYGDSSKRGTADRNMVLGVFRCRISVAGSRKAGVPWSTEGQFPEAIVSPDTDHAHFVIASRLDLSVRKGNFHFVVLPPGAAYTHLEQSVPLVSRLTLSRQKANWSPLDALYKQAIKEELGIPSPIDITGALGDWTVLILSSKANDEEDRKQIIEEIVKSGLVFTLKVPCLKVRMDSPSPK